MKKTMRNMMRRVLVAAAMLCAAGAAMPLFTEELTREEDFSCEVLDDMSNIKITGIKAKDKNKVTKVVIPDAIDGVPVTAISSDAFSECEALVSVSIPNTVTSIDWDAFDGCTSLRSIKIPDSVTYIGLCAFQNCKSLVSITLPKSLKVLCNRAFRGCTSLKSIVIPDAVTEIQFEAFLGCTALESFTLPASLETVEDSAFEGCSSLKEVIVPDGLTKVNFKEGGFLRINVAFTGCSSMSVKSQIALRKLGYMDGF